MSHTTTSGDAPMEEDRTTTPTGGTLGEAAGSGVATATTDTNPTPSADATNNGEEQQEDEELEEGEMPEDGGQPTADAAANADRLEEEESGDVKGEEEPGRMPEGGGGGDEIDDDRTTPADSRGDINNNNDSSSSDTNSTKPEQRQRQQTSSYSTRGRTQGENALDRLAAAGDLLSVRNSGATTGNNRSGGDLPTSFLPHGTTVGGGHRADIGGSAGGAAAVRMRESFLSESLTEEERRTRTRYLPEVDGMHSLRKLEIKSDLALARQVLNASSGLPERLAPISAAPSARASSGSKRSRSSDMDIGESGEDTPGFSEDDRLSDGMRQGGLKTIALGSTELVLPSPAFVAPPTVPDTASSTTNAAAANRPSPEEVDSVAAFNPPRPPESVGAKKKHRIVRWERRPTDIEVDLSNYRKTVQRTRAELRHAQEEQDRIVTVDNHLRRHFLDHLRCLREEMALVSAELARVQQECVDLADLPNSRTRTRGAFKGSTAMRDVLLTLRAKGKDIAARGLSIPQRSVDPSSSIISENNSKARGIGGVSAVSFVDWDRSTKIDPGPLCPAWIIPGDFVETPYGKGTAVAVYGPTVVDPEDPPGPELLVDAATGKTTEEASHDAMDIDSPPGTGKAGGGDSAEKKKTSPKGNQKKSSPDNQLSFSKLLAPRVAVRLPFGVAIFNLNSVVSLEDPTTYDDERMAKRWKDLAETATSVGSFVDIAAMSDITTKDEESEAVVDNQMGVDGPQEGGQEDAPTDQKKHRLVPFGSGMFPTALSRGALLHKASFEDLQKQTRQVLYSGGGVLGSRDNPGVSVGVREFEDQRQEHLDLKAKVLQLRNQLYRQHRTRILNERTYTATQERASRVESLVAQLRTDLKSLKRRLDVEICDLGIGEEEAENILTSFYMSLDSQHQGEASPPKRPRRHSRLDEENDEDMEDTEGIPGSEAEGATDADIPENSALATLASTAAANT